jgi:Protein of unknwon function (DUF3310)
MTTPHTNALDTQIGGDHYRNLKIQPVEYIHANNLPFIEGCIVKYATRWREKGGVKDLEKIKHFVDLLIELEFRSPQAPVTSHGTVASIPTPPFVGWRSNDGN